MGVLAAETKEVYPPKEKIWSAFDMPFDSVKVVIVGQDPYHGPGQANGLAFSVNKGVTVPPSLKNIYKELKDDLGIVCHTSGDLSSWVKQGVLLLNTSLTVKKSEPGSHKDIGWHEFTKEVLKIVSKNDPVFILWGKHAQEAVKDVEGYKIISAHPSPFSADRGFFGSKPFTKCNKHLESQGKSPIDWSVK